MPDKIFAKKIEKLQRMEGGAEDTVKVAVRCRPMNSKEKASEFADVIRVDESRGEIHVINPAAPTVSLIYSWVLQTSEVMQNK